MPVTADLVALVRTVARELGRPVALVDAEHSDGRLANLTLRVDLKNGGSVEMDIAHVETFEESTWEAPPHNLSALVGARGHTLHTRKSGAEFRLATWVDSFDADTITRAVRRRLARRQ